MTQNIETFIEDYLNKRTDYAIQIDGNWGIGKTYYYRQILSDLISKTPCIENHRKNYKPIYISLFGLKSIEDIATKIVLEFYQSKLFKGYFSDKRNQKTLKVTEGIFKIGLRGFLSFQRLGNFNDYLTDVQEIGKNALNENEIVICFDDLERRDSSLSLQDLIGYINSLVDEKIKILIIANEDILKKGAESNYKDLKEKVIGITVPFIFPNKQIIQSIIQNRFISTGYDIYGNFLLDNIDTIAEIVSVNKNNYRHLIYALNTFQKCYSFIYKEILSTEHELKPHLIKDLGILTKTYLAFAIEYKASNITYEQVDMFRISVVSVAELMQGIKTDPKVQTNEIIVTDQKSFLEKYKLKRNQYKFFECLFQYVTNSKDFDIKDFIEEFRSIYKLNGGSVLLEYQVLQKLAYVDCLDLSDEDYVTQTNQLISYAKKGKYLPSEYLTVMDYSERYDNPLGLDLDIVCKELKAGLKKAIQIQHNESDFFRFNNSGSSEPSNYYKDLLAFGKQEISNELESRKKIKIEEYINALYSNPKKFFEDCLEIDDYKYDLHNLKLVEKIIPEKLISILINSDKRTVYIAAYFFRNQYKHPSYSKNEESIIQKLIQELKKTKLPENNSKLKTYFINDFIKSLEQIPPLKLIS